MPYYTYEARDKGGKLVKNQAFALNKQELIKILQTEEMMILSITESASLADKQHKKMHKKARVSDLILFAKELAILIENGVPIIEAMDVSLKQIDSIELAKAIKDIKRDLEGGTTFRDAIAKHPRIFSSFWHDMIDAGEVSGQLPFVIRQILTFLESREDMRKKTLNAFIYPAMLLLLAVVVIMVFIFRVVPIFQELFTSFGSKLPIFTQIVINISDVVKKYFFGVAIAIAVIVLIIRQLVSTRPGRLAAENIALSTPVIGNLFLSLAIERFSSTLGVLLKSGIPIIRALEIAIKTSQSVVFAERLEEAKMKIVGGLPFSEALQQSGFLPPLVVQLIVVAEKTGNFSGMLEEISKYYKDVIDIAVTRFTALIGPVVLIFMAVVIGSLIVAMFLPIFKIATLGS